MANEEHVHVAMPKLYGAPAYARPRVVAVMPVERPFDPDALPLEAHQTEEERELARELASATWTGTGTATAEPAAPEREGAPMQRGRPFRLGPFTRRSRGDDDTIGNGSHGS